MTSQHEVNVLVYYVSTQQTYSLRYVQAYCYLIVITHKAIWIIYIYIYITDACTVLLPDLSLMQNAINFHPVKISQFYIIIIIIMIRCLYFCLNYLACKSSIFYSLC